MEYSTKLCSNTFDFSPTQNSIVNVQVMNHYEPLKLYSEWCELICSITFLIFLK